ncbi:MAG: division/cell wall cluster transcriptional repressor MraZ [Candidatus Omnitrophica bacterium]|nr:division/cell wall cluster transcriptional repressor MraZ [Candidatus Omnitrophota bacterium]MCM8799043.1 division/cell wall cluster transcriptional repressor MraZ [Candidatus Omnitrophota bacterium]
MFYGEYSHLIDRKGRIILPAKFRQIVKEKGIKRFYLTRGLDRCLFLFPEEEWHAQEEKFKSLSFTHSESRKFNRLYFSGAQEVIPDFQGRILIPQYLKEFAELKKEIVIIGVSNRIEIWSKALWKEFYENSRPYFEETAEKLLEQ